MITDQQIKDGLNKAYKEAGHNAYFGNGFEAGVKFALATQEVELNSDCVVNCTHPLAARFKTTMCGVCNKPVTFV